MAQVRLANRPATTEEAADRAAAVSSPCAAPAVAGTTGQDLLQQPQGRTYQGYGAYSAACYSSEPRPSPQQWIQRSTVGGGACNRPRRLLPCPPDTGAQQRETVRMTKYVKSRNGCATCKASRRKCDELKPSCSQCLRRQIKCGGYTKSIKFVASNMSGAETGAWQESSTGTSPAIERGDGPETSNARPRTEILTETMIIASRADPPTEADSRAVPRATSAAGPRRADSPARRDTLINGEPTTLLPPPASPSRPQDLISNTTQSLSAGSTGHILNAGLLPFPPQSAPLQQPQTILAEDEILGQLNPNAPGQFGNLEMLFSDVAALPTQNSLWQDSMSTLLDPYNSECQLPDLQHIGPNLEAIDDVSLNSNLLWVEGCLGDVTARSYSNDSDPRDDFTNKDAPPSGKPTLSAQTNGACVLFQHPILHSDSPEMIAMVYNQRVCEVLSIKQDPIGNPWRVVVWPLAKEYPTIYHAVAAMTCFQASNAIPELRQRGVWHLQTSVQALSLHQDNDLRVKIALTATLLLSLAETWYYPRSTCGIKHVRAAKRLLEKAMSLLTGPLPMASQSDSIGSAPLTFLARTWVYMDVLTRITCDNADPYDPTFIARCSSNRDSTAAIHQDDQVDPLMGYADTLFPLLGQVAELLKTVQCRQGRSNSPAIIASAVELKELIESWTPCAGRMASSPASDLDESLTSAASDLLQTAKAYKWATLLLLCQAVPELPIRYTFEGLAQKILTFVATVPVKSRASIFHVFPLMIAGCDTTDPDDREWVRERWCRLSSLNSSGISDRCLELTSEAWRRRDSYEKHKQGDPNQVAAVENAIIFQHSIFTVQFISRNLALNVSFESSAGVANITLFQALSNQHDEIVDTGVYEPTALYTRGAQSAVQDPIATSLLQALLLTTFTLTLVGWVLGARRPILLRPSTSIASVLALLAEGDALEHMYGGGRGDCLTLNEAMSRFDENCGFRLEWGQGNDDRPDAPQRFSIWVTRNFVVDIDSDDTSLDDEII